MRPVLIRKASPLVRAGLSGIICMLLTATGGAQERKSPDEPPQLGPPRVQLPQHIEYSTWRKICFKGSDNVTLCRTTSTGTDEIGQVVLRVDLIERADGPAARLQLFVPQGLSLQAGVTARVDNDAAAQFPYTYCLSNICIAAGPATPALIGKMDSGQILKIEQTDFKSSPVTMNVLLDQFTTAHKGLPAANYDYNLTDD